MDDIRLTGLAKGHWLCLWVKCILLTEQNSAGEEIDPRWKMGGWLRVVIIELQISRPLWHAGLTLLLQGRPLCLWARADLKNGPFGLSAGHRSNIVEEEVGAVKLLSDVRT